MISTDNIVDQSTSRGRRLRPNTADEQEEMIRLGRQLIGSGVTREEIQSALGYEAPDMLDAALASGRATTARLEKLRDLATIRLPAMVQTKLEESAREAKKRYEMNNERFLSHAERLAEAVGAPAPEPVQRSGARKRERRRDHLTPKQHKHLRGQIEHLWAVDRRFKNWSLLARIAGLSTGPAIKRAYEVGSSLDTMQKIDTFVRLHAAFGSRAFDAVNQGVATADLQEHLVQGGEAAGAIASERADATPKASPATNTLAPTPPSVNFQNILALSTAVDTEVSRLFLTAEFFERLASEASMPTLVRQNAGATAAKIREAVGLFAPTVAEPLEEG